MWVLYGTYVVLESLCYGTIGPNMFRFPASVRDGSLDLALTRPVDVQFYVSARHFDLNACLNVLLGFALLGAGLYRASFAPSTVDWLLWALLLGCGFVMAYAIWFAAVTLAIWAVKLDGVAVAFDPMMQIARFPVQIYPHRLLWLLTFGLPVAFMTTFPTQALLEQVGPLELVPAAVLAAMLLGGSHFFFHFALRAYGSASS